MFLRFFFTDSNESIVMNAAACPNAKCNEYINVQNNTKEDECGSCGATITTEHISKYYEIMELTKLHIENMKDVACKNFFENSYQFNCI